MLRSFQTLAECFLFLLVQPLCNEVSPHFPGAVPFDPGEEGVDQTHRKGPWFRCVKAWGFAWWSWHAGASHGKPSPIEAADEQHERWIQIRLRYEQMFWHGSADMLIGWVLCEEECSYASGVERGLSVCRATVIQTIALLHPVYPVLLPKFGFWLHLVPISSFTCWFHRSCL